MVVIPSQTEVRLLVGACQGRWGTAHWGASGGGRESESRVRCPCFGLRNGKEGESCRGVRCVGVPGAEGAGVV